MTHFKYYLMKKLLFIIMLMSCLSLAAQQQHKVYCEIVGTERLLSTKVVVSVDFGQDTNLSNLSKQYLVDEEGKAIKFNSMVDAMNFFGELNWIFEQAYVVTTSQQNVYHWLLSKNIINEDDAFEGLITKQQ